MTIAFLWSEVVWPLGCDPARVGQLVRWPTSGRQMANAIVPTWQSCHLALSVFPPTQQQARMHNICRPFKYHEHVLLPPPGGLSARWARWALCQVAARWALCRVAVRRAFLQVGGRWAPGGLCTRCATWPLYEASPGGFSVRWASWLAGWPPGPPLAFAK